MSALTGTVLKDLLLFLTFQQVCRLQNFARELRFDDHAEAGIDDD
jgi:hypothetical protein